MCGSGNRTSCTCSGFCFRLYIVGVVVDQNADIRQLLDLVGVHRIVPEVHPHEHDARFQLRDRFDPVIISVDEVDGEISFQSGQTFDLVVADVDVPERRIRDYDNLELKQFLDVAASFILTDDNGLLCDAYNTTELGEEVNRPRLCGQHKKAPE